MSKTIDNKSLVSDKYILNRRVVVIFCQSYPPIVNIKYSVVSQEECVSNDHIIPFSYTLQQCRAHPNSILIRFIAVIHIVLFFNDINLVVDVELKRREAVKVGDTALHQIKLAVRLFWLVIAFISVYV